MQARIESADAVAIMKLGRHFARVRALIEKMGLTHAAGYCERVTLGVEERISPLESVTAEPAPYFSMILIYKGAEDWIRALPAGGATHAG